MNEVLNALQLGSLALPNRAFMAPLTRCRATVDNGVSTHVPNALMAEYYAQRASAGLVIAEATMVAEHNSAFYAEPGIYNAAQVAGWKLVTDAVHAKGGRIYLQLWHGGRACHPAFNHGGTTVAPSAIAIRGFEVHTPNGKLAHVAPRELRDDEIPQIVATFRQAAVNAKAAGFDGVEVHGANGYLLDQFLRDGTNQRPGAYGGPIANRARLLLEVVDTVSSVVDAERVGVRLSPLNSYNDMRDSNPVALTEHVAKELAQRRIGYLHMMRGDFLGQQTGDVMTTARTHFRGVLVGNMGYTPAEASQAIASSKLDAVAFGTSFLANPDLPKRIATNAPLTAPNPATFYTPGPVGYTDYPSLG